MNHILLIVGCLISIECIYQSKAFSVVNDASISLRKVFWILPNNKVSDHWKEQLIPYYALRIIKSCLKIFWILIFIIIIFILLSLLQDNFIRHLFSMIGIIESFIISILYIYNRKKFVNE